MHHRRVRDGDPPGRPCPAGSIDHDVTHVVPGGVVRDRVQFVGRRVVLGVRGKGALECGAEVVRAHGAEFAVQFVRQRPAFLHRQDAALVRDHVRVAREVVRRHPARVGLTQLRRHLRRPHPAVAVPLRAPAAQPDAVHHSVTEHPVVCADVLDAERVPQVTAVQVVRDAPDDVKAEGGQLPGDRCEGALQERDRPGHTTSRCSGTRLCIGREEAGPEAPPHHTARCRDGGALGRLPPPPPIAWDCLRRAARALRAGVGPGHDLRVVPVRVVDVGRRSR